MPLEKTEAIVLAARPLGDTSYRLTLFSPQLGVVRAAAKGARKPNGRLAGGSIVFAVVEALLYHREGRDFDHLREVHLRWYSSRLAADWRAYLAAGALARVVLSGAEDRTPQPENYGLLRTALELLAGGIDPALVQIFFLKRFLAAGGWWPDLSRCARCGARLTGGVRLNVTAGRAGCPEHAEGGLPLNPGSVKLLETIEQRAVLSGRHPSTVVLPAYAACRALTEYHLDLRLGPLPTDAAPPPA